jgi:hypothetical protein
MVNQHKFYKTEGRWYIDLPNYPGPQADLEMVCGADTMLDIMSEGKESVNILVSENYQPDFSTLTKLEKNDIGSGAYYLLKIYEGKSVNMEMWLCDVTKFVFGDFPTGIFIKKH